MAFLSRPPMPPISGGNTATTLLFERLPDRLFAPLASINRYRYWGLLCRLHHLRFGPEAPLPPSHGFSPRTIAQDIEDEIRDQDLWDCDVGEPPEAPETPINIRANTILSRLIDVGWFRIERHGVEKKIVMRPAVSQFLSVLVNFAETGPVFVSGKIRSIDVNIQQVVEGKADGDTLSETADQARNLLEHVRNTGTNIRDLMESLSAETTTSLYVQRFFHHYIEQVFIGDYRELKAKEHPLSRSAQIIRIVEELSESEEHRNRLITWYETKRCSGDRRKAEKLFERDISRLFELKRIEEYLERLDDEVRRANRRALAFLDYRLRSLRPVDHMVKLAIEAAKSGNPPILGDPFAPGGMVSGALLAEPRMVNERPQPSGLRRHVPSDVEVARSVIMLRAREARSITPPKLAAFVLHQLNGKKRISSSDLTFNSITDIRSYQTLANVGLGMSAQGRRLQLSAMMVAKGFRIRMSHEEEVTGEFITGRPFEIEVGKARSDSKTEQIR